MKAQMVKNAVIVPVGAKGGFVLKHPPADRDALRGECVECYRTFGMRGLLDITDNIVDAETIPPPGVVCYDEDDPYLVVAADKGTATFPDIANGIAGEYSFWLGDAFASGGSTGYDHKAMGITARGAWESVKRHFRALDVDVQDDQRHLVGIGDMAATSSATECFSRHLKLVAAFNHEHIFLDPDPNPEASYAERERSSARALELGGLRPGRDLGRRRRVLLLGQVDRARRRQGPRWDRSRGPHPERADQAILTARVDLLWNGGIGTFVKASTESHFDVGDRANDAPPRGRSRRAPGRRRGRNGFTQGADRVCLAGGRIFTDAIDNSAGVDCSDHEVNIKILLGAVVAAGDMTVKQRNELLAQMTTTWLASSCATTTGRRRPSALP